MASMSSTRPWSRFRTSKLDLVVAGTAEGVLMVESEASELSEDIMLGAVTFGQKEFGAVINLIIDLAEMCAKEPWSVPPAAEAYEHAEAEDHGPDRQRYRCRL